MKMGGGMHNPTIGGRMWTEDHYGNGEYMSRIIAGEIDRRSDCYE